MSKLVRIENLLNDASRKFLSEAQLEPDPALVAEGWQRRFTADEQCIQEVVELYSELGYEVRVEPVKDDEAQGDCHSCLGSAALRLCTVYTRKSQPI